MRRLALTLTLLTLPLVALAEDSRKTPAVLNFKMKDLEGKEVDLARYKGKVVLFVNVASKCGLTPQYEQLQALHDKFAEKGLVIIGVPANEFGRQEPGTNVEIKKFCTSEYGVKFPMLAKVVVKGKGICPLYQYLTSEKSNPKFSGEIKWNFTKFLIDRAGEIINRFEPRVSPDAREMIDAIEAAIKK